MRMCAATPGHRDAAGCWMIRRKLRPDGGPNRKRRRDLKIEAKLCAGRPEDRQVCQLASLSLFFRIKSIARSPSVGCG
jgi:hypothetical protein